MFEPKTLIVVPPFTGHINPTLGVGAELLARQERVAWCGYRLPALPRGAECFTFQGHDPEGVAAEATHAGAELHGLRSVKFFYEEILVPLAHAMLPDVERVIELWQPDLVVVDQQALAGAFAARRAELPWVSSCSTSASVVEPLAAFPKIIGWRDELLADLQRELGLEVERRPGLSKQGVLVFSSSELIGEPLGKPFHCVGPVTTDRPSVPFDFGALDPTMPTVLISLGTISGDRGQRLYAAVAQAFADRPWQAILVAPEHAVGPLPANVLRYDFVPQLQLLPHLAAVVSHGGHNTVVESLAAGKPLVVAPIRDDQPVVAAQVVAAGAGVRVKFGRITGEKLGAALEQVLTDPAFAENARRIGASLTAGGGAVAAADVIEAVRTS